MTAFGNDAGISERARETVPPAGMFPLRPHVELEPPAIFKACTRGNAGHRAFAAPASAVRKLGLNLLPGVEALGDGASRPRGRLLRLRNMEMRLVGSLLSERKRDYGANFSGAVKD